jgi:hypothetical protein
MTSWSDPAVIVALAAVTVGALALIYEVRKNMLHVELERFAEHLVPPHSVAASEWSIRVRPNKTMEHCNVTVGRFVIPIGRESAHPLEVKIVPGGAENFRVPITVNPFGEGDGEIVYVREGKKTVKKQAFRNIPDMTGR